MADDKRSGKNARGKVPPRKAKDTIETDLVGRGMAQWRRERPDIDGSGKAVVGRVLMLQDVILRAVNAALEPYGLRYPAYAALATLRVSGAPYRMSPSHLQSVMLFTSGGVSNLLRRIEAQGLLRRTNDPADGRGVRVELTPEGVALIDQAMIAHAAVERRLCAMFDAAEQNLLAGLLSRMIVQNGAPTASNRDQASAGRNRRSGKLSFLKDILPSLR